MACIQIENAGKFFEKERQASKLRVSELEKRLDGARHDLEIAESKLVAKESELSELQNSLKELEELREMKAVMYQYSFNCRSVFLFLMTFRFNIANGHSHLLKYYALTFVSLLASRILIERMDKLLLS